MTERSIAAEIEERLLVPTYGSRWASASIAAHRGLALPLQLTGTVRRWVLEVAGQPASLLGLGRPKLVEPIAARLFGTLPAPSRESRRILWNPGVMNTEGADLVIAEVHRWMAPRFRRAGWLIIPNGVRWQGDLSQVPPAEPCRSLAEDLRKLVKNGFTATQSTAPADWEEFYREMVQPNALARHGQTAWLPSHRLIMELRRGGILHRIWRDGVCVAGACSLGQGDTLWLPLSGIRHGNEALLRLGAGAAVLALPLQWAREQGYRRVDLGRTGPFLRDGLQLYKRKWGLTPIPDPLAHVAAVWVGSPVARQAFVREPALVEQGAELREYSGAAS
jgi:hypothetical protein